jgi:MFS transporter, SHS family, lactate transporter
METWPARSRGFMGGVLQGSWGLGFLLSSAAYGLLYTSIGWRGLLWMGRRILAPIHVFSASKGAPPGAFLRNPQLERVNLSNWRRRRLRPSALRRGQASSCRSISASVG